MVHEYPELIAELEARTQYKKLGKAAKKDYRVWGVPDLVVTRWKFNEWDYYSEKAKLPISARGLFTQGNRIIARGYNKFFNIGEVKATNLDNLKHQTAGPFYATVKENGFLVLIGAYEGKLVVTSKNSSGPGSSNEVGRNYSETAREWVLKHLASQGKSEADFARLLEENDWTAVGEVCDDSFEEHVLPYPPSIAGVYLNGLNHNTPEFATESPARVLEVCEEFGFRRTEYLEFPDFERLMAFLEGGQKTGKWQEREVEGFVIRCRRPRDVRDESSEYVDFFWKFKFEEPYLMYREWREMVRTYIEKGSSAAYMRAKRSRHSESCLKFLPFARSWLGDHPDLRDRLAKYNLGIIELRTAFFSKHEISETALLDLDLNTPRWLFVTVATIGCGKSTVCNALTHLMQGQWGHTQNDALPNKGKFDRLIKELNRQLESSEVVILDKNNSGKEERAKIFPSFDETAVALGYDMKYVCLNFLPDGPTDRIKQLTRERVLGRGDNHLTIQLSQLSKSGVQGIMSQFENRFDIVNTRAEPDQQFDLVIDLVAGESTQNVRRILDALAKAYAPKMKLPQFTDAEIAAAVQYVRDNEAELAKASRVEAPKGNMVDVKYFGVAIDATNYERLVNLAQNVLRKHDPSVLKNIVLQEEFHVTMAHASSHRKQVMKLKKQHKSKITASGKTILGELHTLFVEGLYWNADLVAFKVAIEGCANQYPHMTVGIAVGEVAVHAITLFDGTAAGVNHVDFQDRIQLRGQELYAMA